jgi:hypothetical protein
MAATLFHIWDNDTHKKGFFFHKWRNTLGLILIDTKPDFQTQGHHHANSSTQHQHKVRRRQFDHRGRSHHDAIKAKGFRV